MNGPVLIVTAKEATEILGFGHFGAAESPFPHEKTEELCQQVVSSMSESLDKKLVENKTSFTTVGALLNKVGPTFANVHLIVANLKKLSTPICCQSASAYQY